MKLYPRLPRARPRDLYDAPVGRGVEAEVADLLYGLVRVTKPLRCLETGTLVGDSAAAIGRALRDNYIANATLMTCDVDHARIAPARERLKLLPVQVVECRGITLIARDVWNFILIDSGSPVERLEEIRAVGHANVAPGGLVCWHDASVAYEEMYHHFSRAVDWPHLVLPSVVGLAVFQRPEE